MLTKEECLKALCRIQCGAKRNKKCEDCKCFDTKINPWKCVENTNESLIIRDLIEEHFNSKSLKFEDLKRGMWVWDVKHEHLIKLKKINEESKKLFIEVLGHDYYTRYVDNRFYPIQIPKAGGEK